MKQLLIIFAIFLSTTSFAQNQVQTETTNMINAAVEKIMQLANAIPEDKYDWSPGVEVRSVSGVLHHVISANYFFGTKLGGSLPAGVNMATLEQDLKTKADLSSALKQSTDFIVSTIKNVKDGAMGDKVEFPFPGEYTVMTAILIAQSHCDEHLGQLIAYSRMNGITPPWSQQ